MQDRLRVARIGDGELVAHRRRAPGPHPAKRSRTRSRLIAVAAAIETTIRSEPATNRIQRPWRGGCSPASAPGGGAAPSVGGAASPLRSGGLAASAPGSTGAAGFGVGGAERWGAVAGLALGGVLGGPRAQPRQCRLAGRLSVGELRRVRLDRVLARGVRRSGPRRARLDPRRAARSSRRRRGGSARPPRSGPSSSTSAASSASRALPPRPASRGAGRRADPRSLGASGLRRAARRPSRSTLAAGGGCARRRARPEAG